MSERKNSKSLDKIKNTALGLDCIVCKQMIGAHSQKEADRCADITELYSRMLRLVS